MFDTTDLLNRLDKLLTQKAADVVLIDTFADIFDGDMNQSNRVRGYLQRFKELANKHNTLFIFNHHCGKKNDIRAPHKDNLLGSQGFESSMRAVIELRMDFKDRGKRHLCIVKGNNMDPKHKNLSYELEFDFENGFVNTGKQVPFSQLVKSDEKESQIKASLHTRIANLKATGLSIAKITEQVKSEGFDVGKSTVGKICKEFYPSIPKPKEKELDGQQADTKTAGEMAPAGKIIQLDNNIDNEQKAS